MIDDNTKSWNYYELKFSRILSVYAIRSSEFSLNGLNQAYNDRPNSVFVVAWARVKRQRNDNEPKQKCYAHKLLAAKAIPTSSFCSTKSKMCKACRMVCIAILHIITHSYQSVYVTIMAVFHYGGGWILLCIEMNSKPVKLEILNRIKW